MDTSNPASILIVGAGSTGISAGSYFSSNGTAVTFLVRPHRQEQLDRPQVLYSYDDHQLHTFADYQVLTDPTQLAGTSFDLVLVTLDGAALQAEAGQRLVDALGQAYRNTPTGIVLLSVGLDLNTWFLERSGLADSQVIFGHPGVLTHEVPAALPLPLHPGVRPDLLAQADYGYRHTTPFEFAVADNAPQVTQAFVALCTQDGVSRCIVQPAIDIKLAPAMLTVMLTTGLMGWPTMADVDPADAMWQLGVNAMREYQRLPVFGAAGLAASEQTSAEGVLEGFQQMEQAALPLDFSAFNKYHHGGKVNAQDIAIFHEALGHGEATGADMPALRELIARLT
ncbi:ketopantoate reductase family protein [Rufibacter latericius]|uniref:Ketopantoate reductase n=1 Tax=Rufibacter latericius TaxID=2487040 RepID=A0A3M9MB05_9BACT|nr:2-dehydropantoate 2-reductase N-terminal domain-containing protein [Rufibacter latericius]RNI22726.1 ketopantoate reductase [Rufibacter latericius]